MQAFSSTTSAPRPGNASSAIAAPQRQTDQPGERDGAEAYPERKSDNLNQGRIRLRDQAEREARRLHAVHHDDAMQEKR